ncbi:O-antigen ligase family protein [Oceanobacillus halophilus]|uniref:O-antigen ligase domain-containing protein n=1 Tax=Oceanobacillus halophilus TaxID=930130 RepID=A0A495A5G0_9BACI|nr:O-antigen ligase family protein [Oceanobacillus halophilus]RKQ34323.1 hypothetical protein D8M06_08075 [Oceanobacillus halophilus]
MVSNVKVTSQLEKFFIYFILFQPILDVVAYLGVPISLLVRVMALGIGLIYIVMLPKSKHKTIAFYILFIIGIFMVSNLLMSWMVKDPFYPSFEISYMVKNFFFIEMLIVYAFVFQSYAIKPHWKGLIERFIFINISLIALVMFISEVTNTSKPSYVHFNKAGSSGWFYAGNELSAILAMGFSVMVLYMINKKVQSRKLAVLPLIILTIWSMMAVGTKVAFGAVLVVLGLTVVYSVIKIFKNKRGWMDLLVYTLLLVGTIAIAPGTAIGENLNLSFGPTVKNIEQETPPKEDIGNDRQLTKEALSGRDDFLKEKQEDYKKAPLIQQSFGMGAAGIYEDSAKLIEMDFFDWFFSYGFIGMILLIIPLLYFVIKILTNLIKSPLKVFDSTIFFVGVGIGLGLGTAFIAGHVLTAPAVSIYLAILISFLSTVMNNTKKE